MRKIPAELDNPIDNVMLSMCEPLCIIFKERECSPNTITTIANIFRGWALMCLWYGEPFRFAFFYTAGHLFDCMDGHYARKYNMCTQFGDYYDHVSDNFWGILIFHYIYTHNIYLVPIHLLFLGAMAVHMGVQQQYVRQMGVSNSRGVLDLLTLPFYKKEWIRWTRHFGCGTFILVSTLLAIMA